jgi:uncharacterized protein YceK
MRLVAPVLSALIAAALNSGCATYMCLEGSQKPIFGGTRIDAQSGVYLVGISLGVNPTEPDAPDRLIALGLSTYFFTDLPFSLLADTITLPVTVWAACNQPPAESQNADRNAEPALPASTTETQR